MRLLQSLLAILFLAAVAAAQTSTEQKARITELKPPAGAKVAIVVFEDLECPDCARAHPLITDISSSEKVPVVRRDFPLSMHPWSRQAAIIARYLDSKSAKLGADFRTWIFANQPSVTRDNLDSLFAKWAQEHGTSVPMVLDPGNRFEAAIEKDVALGKRIGIQHTPTIFIATASGVSGEPIVEVIDRSQMTQMIQDAKNRAGASAAPSSAKAGKTKAATKTSKKS
jgi:protein-disulfide isomerase